MDRFISRAARSVGVYAYSTSTVYAFPHASISKQARNFRKFDTRDDDERIPTFDFSLSLSVFLSLSRYRINRIDYKYDRSSCPTAFERNTERSVSPSPSLSISPVTRFFVLRFSIRSRARIYPLEPAYRYFHPWPGSEISICYLKYQSSPRGPQDKLFVRLGG